MSIQMEPILECIVKNLSVASNANQTGKTKTQKVTRESEGIERKPTRNLKETNRKSK